MSHTNSRLILNPEPEKPIIHILCLDISHYNQTVQFFLCSSAVFVFFILYGYMQELIFTIEGFQTFGWYLTLVQFGFYSIFGLIETRIKNITSRKIPLSTYFLLALLTLGTMGFSNASLGYLNYPTQIIFKCCKLIPVLAGSILIQGKRYGPLDFFAAVLMCVGLTLFTLATFYRLFLHLHVLYNSRTVGLITNLFQADSHVQPNFNTKGITMISMALLCDAVIGNVQEKSMKSHGATNAEVVLYSYFIGFLYLFTIMFTTGDLVEGLIFFSKNPKKTYGYAFIFSVTGYLGIQIVLTLVRTCGAFAAVTVTTCRKAVTIVVSFIFFSKPFVFQYLWSGLLVLVGIYLNLYSKNHPLSITDFELMIEKLLKNLKSKSKFKKYSSSHYMSEV